MFIVGAGNYGHAGHSVAVIGYDKETDRLLIIDSTDSFPADTIPLAYWREFETLITPNERSKVFTFDFGEVITMTVIDDKLSALLQNASFRIEHGSNYACNAVSGGYSLEIPCSPNPKLVVFKATKATQEKIVDLTRAATTSPDYPYAYIFYNIGALNEATNADDKGSRYGYESYYTKYLDQFVVAYCRSCSINVTDTIPKIAVASLYQGEDAQYEWTAYYWDE